MSFAILFGCWGLALALYLGLSEIAEAIRFKNVDVNVKLPPIEIRQRDDIGSCGE